MAKVFAPKPTVPWQPGGLSNPSAPQPVSADGPFMLEYRDAATNKTVREFNAEFTDADATVGDVEIPWETVYRWVSLRKIP